MSSKPITEAAGLLTKIGANADDFTRFMDNAERLVCNISSGRSVVFNAGRVVIGANFESSKTSVHDALEAYGQHKLSLFNDNKKERWNRKLILPDNEHIELFSSKLMSGQFKKFADLVESIDCPIARLVAVHLSNAMLANGTPIQDSYNIDVKVWGTTESFANRKRYYSLIPLISAYGDLPIEYPRTLADLALDQFPCFKKCVKDKLIELVIELAK